jgi:hypothetical protein
MTNPSSHLELIIHGEKTKVIPKEAYSRIPASGMNDFKGFIVVPDGLYPILEKLYGECPRCDYGFEFDMLGDHKKIL